VSTIIDGRVAMVTGAGGGVGRGIALALAAAGARVVVAARRPETGDETADAIGARGGTAISVRCDVTQRSDVKGAVDAAVTRFGSLNVMIHNAISWRSSEETPLAEVTDDQWEDHVAVALRGTFYCAQAAFQHLQRSGSGRYIVIASQSGVEGLAHCPPYGVVKGRSARVCQESRPGSGVSTASP
jgi:3-oxoacyl-[acyl-carrier protein] reductase